jgi:O-antigen/teichoic acid export membrane protein
LIANILLVGVLHLGLAGSLLATGCGYASVVICTLPIILLRAVLRMRADIVRNLLAFGIPIIFNFISYWVLQLADRYLLSVFSSLAETARYGVAYTLGSAISIVVLGPFTLAWPAALFAVAKREDAAKIYKLVFRWFSLFLLFTAFGLSLAGTIVLHWLFPVSYHSGANIIPVVAVSLAFFGPYYVFGVGISITRKTWLTPILLAVAAVVNVALNLVLIPHYGAMGAAVSTLIAYVVLVAISYIVNQRLYPVPFEIGIFLIALLIGTALYIGSDFLGRGFGTYGAWGISACTLLLYGGCLALLGKLLTKNH